MSVSHAVAAAAAHCWPWPLLLQPHVGRCGVGLAPVAGRAWLERCSRRGSERAGPGRCAGRGAGSGATSWAVQADVIVQRMAAVGGEAMAAERHRPAPVNPCDTICSFGCKPA